MTKDYSQYHRIAEYDTRELESVILDLGYRQAMRDYGVYTDKEYDLWRNRTRRKVQALLSKVSRHLLRRNVIVTEGKPVGDKITKQLSVDQYEGVDRYGYLDESIQRVYDLLANSITQIGMMQGLIIRDSDLWPDYTDEDFAKARRNADFFKKMEQALKENVEEIVMALTGKKIKSEENEHGNSTNSH